MTTLALNIDMHDKRVLIVGGGAVAVRKLRTFLQSGAAVKIVAPQIRPEIEAQKASDTLIIKMECYTPADLDDVFMAVAATDSPQVNQQVCSDARQRGILVAVADNPPAGDCVFPAILQRGGLSIAVSTGGRCPSFAADVRDRIADVIGDDYGTILERLSREREKLLTNKSPSTYNTQVLRSLARHLLAEPTERKEPVS